MKMSLGSWCFYCDQLFSTNQDSVFHRVFLVTNSKLIKFTWAREAIATGGQRQG